MATIVLSGDGFVELANVDVADLWVHSTSVFQSSSVGVVDTGDADIAFQGTGLGNYDAHGYATSGTITKFAAVFPGTGRADWTGLSVNAAHFEHAIKVGNLASFIDDLWGGNDTITTNPGGALVSGFDGNDTITGKGSPDAILGGDGNDVIKGGGGGDLLEGDLGKDTLTGGTSGGADTFIFNSVAESTTGSTDTIKDLQNADVIRLTDIDADTGTPDDQPFFIVAAFNGVPGEMTLTFDAAHNRTVIRGDTNGDSIGNLVIYATGDHHTFSNFEF